MAVAAEMISGKWLKIWIEIGAVLSVVGLFEAQLSSCLSGSKYDPPAATELEIVVMEWLLKLLQLPKSFSFSSDGGGVMHGTTCESFVCTSVAVREKKLSQIGNDKGDTLGKLVVYCSDQTHCSLQKVSQIVGICPNNVHAIPTTKSMFMSRCIVDGYQDNKVHQQCIWT